MIDSTPKYIALYQQLKAEIISSKYPAGSFLPIESELAKLYSTSRTTVRRAISMLKSEKLIDVKQGRGTEVLPIASFPSSFKKFRNVNNISARLLAKGEINTIGSIIDIVAAEQHVAEKLNIEIGTKVYRLQKLQNVNDVPFAFMVHYLPCDIVPNLEMHNGKISNLAAFLIKEYGLTITGIEETISAVSAGFIESRILNVDLNSPLLVFKRLSYCDDTLVEYGETLTHPKLFEVVVQMEGYYTLLEETKEEL